MNLKAVNVMMLTLFLTGMSFNLTPAITKASSSKTTFSVQPPSVIGLVPGSSFSVNIYVYEAVDVYAWQVYMEWDPAVLTATGIVFGGFLADKPQGSQTFSRVERDHLLAFETAVGSCVGGKFTPIGLLCIIFFSVESWGDTVLNISGGEEYLTYYVRSADLPKPVPYYPIIQNGYFLNRLPWWLTFLISLLRMFGLIPP